MIEAQQRVAKLTEPSLVGARDLAANFTVIHPITLGFAAASLLSLVFFGLFLREGEVRRAREAALTQAARLEALGRLTCGVTHDFKNVLMVIQGSLASLRRKVKEPTAEPQLDAIQGAIEQAIKLVKQLLIYARCGDFQPSKVDLDDAVDESMAAVRELAGPGVTVERRRSGTRAPVEICPIHLLAAILNLVANACDAMPSGGVLEFAVQAHEDMVELSVSDTGEGVPPEVLPRVFEPFFTTKGKGKGTGLGLAQVRDLVQRAGGSVHIRSTVGQGTVVILRLPRAPGGAEVPTTKPGWNPPYG